MTRDQTLQLMAEAIHRHLDRADMLLVLRTATQHPERMHALLALGAGEHFTEQAFAAFALRCAKGVQSGPQT